MILLILNKLTSQDEKIITCKLKEQTMKRDMNRALRRR